MAGKRSGWEHPVLHRTPGFGICVVDCYAEGRSSPQFRLIMLDTAANSHRYSRAHQVPSPDKHRRSHGRYRPWLTLGALASDRATCVRPANTSLPMLRVRASGYLTPHCAMATCIRASVGPRLLATNHINSGTRQGLPAGAHSRVGTPHTG